LQLLFTKSSIGVGGNDPEASSAKICRICAICVPENEILTDEPLRGGAVVGRSVAPQRNVVVPA
jgi:hypothetical protein